MYQITVTPVEIDMTIKVLLAAIFGLMIGAERRGGPTGAGLRTFCLICMGSAMLTVVSIHGFPASDPSRLAAQIVTGIGFIGAGVIWRQREEAIHGITTAAAILVTSAVGISVGVGFYLLSLTITLITMLILSRGHPVKEAKQSIQSELKAEKTS